MRSEGSQGAGGVVRAGKLAALGGEGGECASERPDPAEAFSAVRTFGTFGAMAHRRVIGRAPTALQRKREEHQDGKKRNKP